MNFARCSLVLVALALLGPAFSGCLAGTGDRGAAGSRSSQIDIPAPASGLSAHYIAEDGTPLNVSVGGFAERKDAWLNDRIGRVVDYEYPWSVPDGRRFPFEETIDPTSGLIIQQWARCWNLGQEDGHRTCGDGRSISLPGAHGWPGGLGAAPFWGNRLGPGNLSLPLELAFSESLTLPYTITLTPSPDAIAESRTCLLLHPADVSNQLLWVLEFIGGVRPFTLCDGFPLPVRFESADRRTFQLETWSLGTGEVDRPSDRSASVERNPVVPLRHRRPPVFAETPEAATPFSTNEAHDVALERVAVYASLFEEAPNATLVFSHYSQPSSGQAGPIGLDGSSVTHERMLKAFADDGQWVYVRIEKRVEEGDHGVRSEVAYDVVEEQMGQHDEPFFQRALLDARQADLNATIRLSERLTGRPLDRAMGFGASGFWPRGGWLLGGHDWRPHGAPAVVWLEDATQEGDDGPPVFAPHRVVIDGPTGAVLYVEGPRSNLTETMR